jgi:hypothetical protein
VGPFLRSILKPQLFSLCCHLISVPTMQQHQLEKGKNCVWTFLRPEPKGTVALDGFWAIQSILVWIELV